MLVNPAFRAPGHLKETDLQDSNEIDQTRPLILGNTHPITMRFKEQETLSIEYPRPNSAFWNRIH